MVAATALPTPQENLDRHLADHADKELLRLAVVGSVDDGKSTLIGRLLHECNGLFADQIASVEKASGGKQIDYSLFTDGLKAEREQGITIDVAYRYFSTEKRKIIVADTPGHIQYTRNMATGASTADAAVILVDARLGVLPQTRRHAYIASLLGIPYLAVAINKIDLVDYSQTVYESLSAEVHAFTAQLGFDQVRSFPVSAVVGDNVTRPSARTPWNTAGTLLQWLESLPHQRRAESAPWRMPVQTVIRPNLDYRGFAGQIASGTVRVGDEIEVFPSRRRTRVAAIDTFEGPIAQAAAPRSVMLRLADEVDITRGDLLAHVGQAPLVLHSVEASVVWFGDKPLQPGQRFLVKHTSRHVPAHVEEILWRKELGDLSQVAAAALALNDIGRVTLTCKRPLLCDPYTVNRTTGAFILIDPTTHDTVGAGMIVGPGAGEQQGARSRITPAERQEALGQKGAVILVPPSLDVGALFQLERALFDAGRHVAVSRGDLDAAVALAEAGLVALLHASNGQAHNALKAQLHVAHVAWLDAPGGKDVAAVIQAFLTVEKQS